MTAVWLVFNLKVYFESFFFMGKHAWNFIAKLSSLNSLLCWSSICFNEWIRVFLVKWLKGFLLDNLCICLVLISEGHFIRKKYAKLKWNGDSSYYIVMLELVINLVTVILHNLEFINFLYRDINKSEMKLLYKSCYDHEHKFHGNKINLFVKHL